MLRKYVTVFGAALLVVSAIGVPVVEHGNFEFQFSEAEARRSGGGGFSRSSFRSGSRSNSSKSSLRVYRPKASSKPKGDVKTVSTGSGGGSSKTRAVRQPKPGDASFAKLPAGKQRSLGKKAIQAERDKFKKKPVYPSGVNPAAKPSEIRSVYRERYRENPIYQRAGGFDNSTYYQRRGQMMNNWNQPSYISDSSPSFGMFDALALYWMIDALSPNQSAQFAYNQQNNPDWVAARAEMDQLAQSNAELAAKLAAMDLAKNEMKGEVDPNFVPEGIDPDLLLSQEALTSTRPDFRMCVASESGAYFRAAAMFSNSIDRVNIVPVVTMGSGDSIDAIKDGRCDGAFVQSDSYWNYAEAQGGLDLPFEVVFSPFKEQTHLICRGEGKIDDLKDLKGRTNVRVLFPKGSGAADTWANIVAENNAFDGVKTVLNDRTINVSSNEDAYMQAIGDDDKRTCLLYVGAPNTGGFTRMVENSAVANDMVLIDMKDHGIAKTTDPAGRKVYEMVELSDSVYPNLIRDEMWGYIDNYSIKTDIIISDSWKSENEAMYPVLVTDMMGLNPQMSMLVKQ